MCGIAGYISEKPISPDVLKKMLVSIAHRGPDAQSEFHSGSYHVGMCRLAINDIDHGGQPLFNYDKSIVLMYNGEIYNSPKLREQLKAKGVVFRTHSDGEVICHLYEQYGDELFKYLDGMFAIALWDTKLQRLLLARDLPGEKPLYYAELASKQLVFASEIKALKQFQGLNLTLDYQAIWDLPTFLWIPEPSTPYNEVKALPRGHIMCVDENGVSIKPYKNKFNQSNGQFTDEEVIQETRSIVKEAVHSRLLSDVPIGCFLSGGLDSSIVTTLARRELETVDTFCIGFEDLSDPYHGRSDESEYASNYAKQLGCRHHNIKVTAKDFLDDLDRFILHADQPFGVSSGLGVLSIARAAREAGIKVLLSGDCADECFGGYSWYTHLANESQYDKITRNDRVPSNTPISFQNFGLDLSDRLQAISGYTAHEQAWAWHYYAHESEKQALYSDDFASETKSSLRHFAAFNPATEWSPETFIAQDRDFYLPQEMLRKVDRMTMAYSVEGRVPFAAPSVLAHANKLSYKHQVRGDCLKWALRKAFEDYLPEEIIDRPKHGFNIPIDHWLKNEWKDLLHETFGESSALSKQGLIRKSAGNVAEKMLNDPLRLNGHTIFCFIMLNRWLEGI